MFLRSGSYPQLPPLAVLSAGCQDELPELGECKPCGILPFSYSKYLGKA